RQDLLRRRVVLEVAGEVRTGLDQHLAVVRDTELDVRERGADRAEAVARRPVDGCAGRAFGQSVALEDEDVDGVEELDDLLGQRRAARDADTQPPPEAVLDLRVDEPVGQAVLDCKTAREALSRLSELARTSADAQGPLDQRALGPLRLAELRRHSRVY